MTFRTEDSFEKVYIDVSLFECCSFIACLLLPSARLHDRNILPFWILACGSQKCHPVRTCSTLKVVEMTGGSRMHYTVVILMCKPNRNESPTIKKRTLMVRTEMEQAER